MRASYHAPHSDSSRPIHSHRTRLLHQLRNFLRLSPLLLLVIIGFTIGRTLRHTALPPRVELPIASPRIVETAATAIEINATRLSTVSDVNQLNAGLIQHWTRRDIAGPGDNDDWPLAALRDTSANTVKSLESGTQVKCISRGMQEKCLFRNLVVRRNSFYVYHPLKPAASGNILTDDVGAALSIPLSLSPVAQGHYPNPIFPPDGQNQPLIQNHKYRGHPIHILPNSGIESNVNDICTRVVTRPTMFVFRMSGHSTYHLWENNLGPFFATLQDSFDLPAAEAERWRNAVLDEKRLLIAFVDKKPREGPKAPKLLDQLLRLFTDTPLLNASALTDNTCFTNALVGWSANKFPHRQLVREVLSRMLNISSAPQPSAPRPAKPSIIYISRNHPSVTRGRKMVNEEEIYPRFNQSMYDAYGVSVRKVFMEDLSFPEQVRLASQTNVMFSPHGGGVANCIWMSPGSVVVEFVAPVGKTLPGMYHTMCGNSGVKHIHFLADADPRDANIRDNARLFSNLVMPFDRLMENAHKAMTLFRQT